MHSGDKWPHDWVLVPVEDPAPAPVVISEPTPTPVAVSAPVAALSAPAPQRLQIQPGKYKIRTVGHQPSNQPAGWGLSAFHFKAASEQAAPPPVDLTTGIADWRMPQQRGKFAAGAAPKTPAHGLWYQPKVGSWIGSRNNDWPVGDTTFTVSFNVPGPEAAHFALEYTVDNKVKSAALNGKPLNIGKNLGFKQFGGEMKIVAPQGKGLFVKGANTLSVVVDNSSDSPNPAGLYIKGSAVVGAAVKVRARMCPSDTVLSRGAARRTHSQ